MSETPVRRIRIDDDLWTSAQEVAAVEHSNVSDVIRRALVAYIKEQQS
jgi:predicted transcriptional regulator